MAPKDPTSDRWIQLGTITLFMFTLPLLYKLGSSPANHISTIPHADVLRR